MASFVVDNNVESTVADNPLAQAATTLNVANGEGANFPSTFPFRLTIWDEATHSDPGDDSGMEIVECTARATDALTITRGKEGTGDVAHANGERVAILITAGLFNDATYGITTKLDGIEASADVTDSTNVNAAGAIMENDYNPQTVIVAVSDNTPVAETIDDGKFVGRPVGGNVGNVTPTQARAIINVAAGADVTGSNPPQSHGASVHTDRTRYVYLTSPHVLSSVTPNLYGSSFSADGDEYLAFNIRMPNDFSSFTSVKMIYAMNSANAGDVVISGRSRYGGIGESKSIHSDNDNDNIITPGNDSNIHEYTFAGLFTSVTADDYVNIFISRTGTSGDDTHTQAMILLGVIVTYTADM